MTLSPQMDATLWAIVNQPGKLPNSYPGGGRTVGALRRRGLVRYDPVMVFGMEADAVYPTASGLRVAHGGEVRL